MLLEFEKKALKAIELLKGYKEVFLIFHDDADGICSAAIIFQALKRENFSTKIFCLEKVYEEIIQKLQKNKRAIFYCDIGSSHGDLISDLNKEKNLVIILDHHDVVPSHDKMVFDLNLENFGYKGEKDFSGSTCCYLFSKILNKKNFELAYLAITGSLEIPGELSGLNKEVLEEAIKEKIVEKIDERLYSNRIGMYLDNLFSKLQILGAVGYYENGPELGIELCINGENEKIKRKINELDEKRKIANKKLLSRLYEGALKKGKFVQWFDSENFFENMGTKVIGTFCSFLSYQKRIDQNKFIIGFMEVPNLVPGIGKLKENYVKISIRAPEKLRENIDKKTFPSALDVLKNAIGKHGLADGHSYAASAIIKKEKIYEAIEKAENFIQKFKSKQN